MSRTRKVVLAAISVAAIAAPLSACGGPDGRESDGSRLEIIERTTTVTGYDGTLYTIKCLSIDSSRGVALSCARPDDIRNFISE